MNIKTLRENGRKILYGGLAGLMLLGAGCNQVVRTNNNLSLNLHEYSPISTNSVEHSKIVSLEGKIVDVQDGHISFYYSGRLSIRNFKFVVVQGNENKTTTLLYPQPYAFVKGVDAAIQYSTLPLGQINAQEFLDTFVIKYNPNSAKRASTDDNLSIFAGGIILPNGVSYHTNYSTVTPEAPVQTSIFNNL